MSELWTRAIWSIAPLALVLLSGCDPDGEPAPLEGDVGIRGVVTTQGVQDETGGVPLLPDKPIAVRVFIEGNDGGDGATILPPVAARLTLDGGDPRAPDNTTVVVPHAEGSDEGQLLDSFLFLLPEEASRAGTHHVRVELILPAGYTASSGAALVEEWDYTVVDPKYPLVLKAWGLAYGYSDLDAEAQAVLGISGTTWPARPVSDLEPQRVGALQRLPLSGLTIEPLELDKEKWFPCDFNGSGCAGYADARAWAIEIMDQEFPGGGEVLILLQPEISFGHLGAHTWTPSGNAVINLQADTYEIGQTLAHEVYHHLGLPHTWENPVYPRGESGALGPFVGVELDPLRIIPGTSASGEVLAYDLMSYDGPSWASPFTYCVGLFAISQGDTKCPEDVDGWILSVR